MQVFIGNNTRQRHIIHYRLPEQKQNSAYQLTIPMGGQAPIPHDLTSDDWNYVLHQLEPYGIIDAASVDRKRGYVGFTFRVEKPISETSLNSGVEKNVQAAVARSNEVFERTGVGLAQVQAQRAAEEGNTLNRSSISVQEDFMGEKPKSVIAKGIEVTPRGARKT